MPCRLLRKRARVCGNITKVPPLPSAEHMQHESSAPGHSGISPAPQIHLASFLRLAPSSDPALSPPSSQSMDILLPAQGNKTRKTLARPLQHSNSKGHPRSHSHHPIPSHPGSPVVIAKHAPPRAPRCAPALPCSVKTRERPHDAAEETRLYRPNAVPAQESNPFQPSNTPCIHPAIPSFPLPSRRALPPCRAHHTAASHRRRRGVGTEKARAGPRVRRHTCT